jgi:hypothetical protein
MCTPQLVLLWWPCKEWWGKRHMQHACGKIWKTHSTGRTTDRGTDLPRYRVQSSSETHPIGAKGSFPGGKTAGASSWQLILTQYRVQVQHYSHISSTHAQRRGTWPMCGRKYFIKCFINLKLNKSRPQVPGWNKLNRRNRGKWDNACSTTGGYYLTRWRRSPWRVQ